MDEEKVFEKSSDVVAREFEGKLILMPLHASSKDLNCIYTLNNTASFAWSLIDGKNTLGGIKQIIMERYEVDDKKLEEELNELVSDLLSVNAIR